MIIVFYIEKKNKKGGKKKMSANVKRERERLDGRSIEDSSLSSPSYLLSSSFQFSFFSLFSVVKKNQKANSSFQKKVELLKKMS
jgi:hypothetical protein